MVCTSHLIQPCWSTARSQDIPVANTHTWLHNKTTQHCFHLLTSFKLWEFRNLRANNCGKYRFGCARLRIDCRKFAERWRRRVGGWESSLSWESECGYPIRPWPGSPLTPCKPTDPWGQTLSQSLDLDGRYTNSAIAQVTSSHGYSKILDQLLNGIIIIRHYVHICLLCLLYSVVQGRWCEANSYPRFPQPAF